MSDGVLAVAEEQGNENSPAIEVNEPDNEQIVDQSEEDQDDGQLEGAENEEGSEGGEPEEPEIVFEEVEYNGKKYQVPAELKNGFMMNADYTRKTQEVAEMRKAIEARQQEAEQVFNTSQEVIAERAKLMNIDAQLKQYTDLTSEQWQQIEMEDPMAAQSHWRQFQMLKDQRGQIAASLDEVQKQRSEQAEQATVNRLRQTQEFAQKEIPGWNTEIDAKITSFATDALGFTREQLVGAIDPQIYKTLHLAWIGSQSLAKQKAASQPKAQVIQPLKTVAAKGNPAAKKSLEDMSMDEYAAYMNKRDAQRSKR